MDTAIADALTRAIGTTVHANSSQPVGGGSIHSAVRCRTDRGFVFVKLGPLSVASMLAAEAAGLDALKAAQCIRVPAVLALGATDRHAYLCLEWLDLQRAHAHSQVRLGEQLASLHRVSSERFGFATDNFIGATPQRNVQCDDWVQFFREQRLLPQLDLAADNGADAKAIDHGRRLAESLAALFEQMPIPSLVHGDLWGGNWGALTTGEPVIFDPAVYFGDRETDLAMTQLFGGFSRDFYAAYVQAWPLPSGAQTRVALYSLYHVLNHFNLFGGGYLAQARTMIDGLLSELRG